MKADRPGNSRRDVTNPLDFSQGMIRPQNALMPERRLLFDLERQRYRIPPDYGRPVGYVLCTPDHSSQSFFAIRQDPYMRVLSSTANAEEWLAPASLHTDPGPAPRQFVL
jgi:hypothetical protein